MTTSTSTGTAIVCMRILAVPFGEAALVRDLGPNGEPMLIRELFDSESFGELPDKMPLQRAHLRSEPIGWARPTITETGLLIVAELVDTARARDSVTEARAGLMAGASMGFLTDAKRDRWTLPKQSFALPTVTRRNVELVEVSIVPRGAYPGARVTEIYDRDQRQHEQSDREMADFRAEKVATEAAKRTARDDLNQWVRQIAGERREALLAPIPVAPGGLSLSDVEAVTVRGQSGSFIVRGTKDLDQAMWKADAFETERAQLFRMADRTGNPITERQLDHLMRKHRVEPV